MPADTGLFMPLFIAAGALVVYTTVKFLPAHLRRWSGTMSAVWLMAAFGIMLSAIIPHASVTGLSYIGLTAGRLITGIGAAGAFASQGRIDPEGPVQLYYPLFLLALAGSVAVGFAGDLFTVFVAVELSAIPVYGLCAYRYREDPGALTSAARYLFQGVVGTITALFGVAVLFAAGHTLRIADLPAALGRSDPALVLLGAVLIIIGYGVKLAIVPMHTWLPDAYARAPVGVTAIMAGATKIGVLIAVFLSLSALPADATVPRTMGIFLIIIAVTTMTMGNLLALNQRDLKDILSYSSIAQMGYILLGFGIGMAYSLPLGFTAGLYYAIAYGMMKSGAFLSADAFAWSAGSSEIAGMKGLGAKNPLLGISFVIFIFGLIGVPFTSGFLGKLLLEQAGMVTSMLSGFVLALILAINSIISLGYYVPVLSMLFFEKETEGKTGTPSGNLRKIPFTSLTAVTLLAIITVYFGLFPESFDWISHAAGQLFTWGVL